jgi:hypothetical protein
MFLWIKDQKSNNAMFGEPIYKINYLKAECVDKHRNQTMQNYKEHTWKMCALETGLFAFIILVFMPLQLLNFLFRIL